jgi:hypothetical protein
MAKMTTIPAKMTTILAQDDSFSALFRRGGKRNAARRGTPGCSLFFISTPSILSGGA